MLFSMLLTGVVYPRNVMPLIPQLIGNILPLTYFIRISRGIIMKGVGVTVLWPDVAALVVYSLVVMIVRSLEFQEAIGLGFDERIRNFRQGTGQTIQGCQRLAQSN